MSQTKAEIQVKPKLKIKSLLLPSTVQEECYPKFSLELSNKFREVAYDYIVDLIISR